MGIGISSTVSGNGISSVISGMGFFSPDALSPVIARIASAVGNFFESVNNFFHSYYGSEKKGLTNDQVSHRWTVGVVGVALMITITMVGLIFLG